MKQDTITGRNHGENYCYYYLHTNGDLIHKSKHCDVSDFEESSFVKKWWLIDLDDRVDIYNMLIHASMLGIKKERLKELVNRWNITDDDATHYCKSTKLTFKMDGSAYCVHGDNFTNLEECTIGFGNTLFEAICEFMKLEVMK